MLIDWLSILGGFVVLVAGGEALVRGATGIALAARVTPAVIGLTVVAAGTSMPELVVSVQAALEGSPGLAVGNVVGSNLFNIGAILGISALVRPLRIEGNTIRLEWPVMMLAACQLHLLARDRVVDRLEGSFLLLGLVAFMAYAVFVGRTGTGEAEQQQFADAVDRTAGVRGVMFSLGAVALGIALLAGGSTALLRGAVGVASGLGVSETVIGLTVVAAGTSTPELVTALLAARRGQDDIAVGNVVGSNIFNTLGIAGATATIAPLPVPPEVLARDNLWMLGASVVLLPLIWTGRRVSRLEGAGLLAGFSLYMVRLLR